MQCKGLSYGVGNHHCELLQVVPWSGSTLTHCVHCNRRILWCEAQRKTGRFLRARFLQRTGQRAHGPVVPKIFSHRCHFHTTCKTLEMWRCPPADVDMFFFRRMDPVTTSRPASATFFQASPARCPPDDVHIIPSRLVHSENTRVLHQTSNGCSSRCCPFVPRVRKVAVAFLHRHTPQKRVLALSHWRRHGQADVTPAQVILAWCDVGMRGPGRKRQSIMDVLEW